LHSAKLKIKELKKQMNLRIPLITLKI